MNPLILSIETATMGGSVCLSAGDTVLAAVAGDPKLSHSNTLLSDINKCLREAGVAVQDVELFATTSGPGSFTGLRIGLATIKALAATLNRPCVGVPTLQVIAHTAGVSNATVALLPAGRSLAATLGAFANHCADFWIALPTGGDTLDLDAAVASGSIRRQWQIIERVVPRS